MKICITSGLKTNKSILVASMLCMLLICACKNEDISYSTEIKPLLNEKCLRCHGGIRANGEFSLLFKETALAENASGNRAIVPGNPGASELIKRVKEADPELRMPQDGAPLTPDEIDLLERWIAQGAKWDNHWAYVAPRKTIPDLRDDWTSHELDKFILEQMFLQGLVPAQQAAREDLLRRAALDVTGLPPEPRLAGKFLAGDLTYASLVDSLLGSIHFGEHWASMWLDLARYADTKGYEKDGSRTIWRYRDWVINAFNADLSFDQFTIQQLAGDLLDNPTKDQRIATAFHRNTMTNSEGGTEDEEYRTAAVIDRVNTTFEVWQGMTMSCVQCHSHPYDPIKHEDFYRIYAAFNSTMDADLDSEFPYLMEVRDSLHSKEINEIAAWIDADLEIVNEDGLLSMDDVRSVMKPLLIPILADDFQDVLISNRGSCSNNSYNANNQKYKRYYLVFEEVDLSGITDLKFTVAARGDDARIDVRLETTEGPTICSAPFKSTRVQGRPEFSVFKFPILQHMEGKHRLIVQIINTTDRLPDGLIDLRSVELIRGDQPLADDQVELRKEFLASYLSGIRTPIMREKSGVLARTTQVFDRGSYLAKTDTVTAGLPELYDFSHPIENRLDLARWLVSDKNPLTARVYVNRVWNQIFGRGLVEPLDDFGSQSIPSIHQDLLDYLAVQFSTEWKWSTKRLVKEILSSSTYQQSSDFDATKSDLDPNNIYYSRAPRTRLSAEQIRDQALALAGLLTDDICGPSVMPPQPDGIWRMPYSGEKWINADDKDRHRRGLYTFWRRTTPYPSMVAFDTPSREVCVSKRVNTNTPLQALVTLNDPVYIEAAQSLGKWMEEIEGSTGEKIAAGFNRALLRDPTHEELNVLLQLYDGTLGSEQPQATASMDAYDIIASTILNMDALLTKS